MTSFQAIIRFQQFKQRAAPEMTDTATAYTAGGLADEIACHLSRSPSLVSIDSVYIEFVQEVKRPVGETATAFSASPVWFGRLDRNGDSELTRREFPGTIAAFQKLDRNSDGVVDTAEATFVK